MKVKLRTADVSSLEAERGWLGYSEPEPREAHCRCYGLQPDEALCWDCPERDAPRAA